MGWRLDFDRVKYNDNRPVLDMFVEDVDLFVTDIGLPDGDGISLYRELTAEKKIRRFF